MNKDKKNNFDLTAFVAWEIVVIEIGLTIAAFNLGWQWYALVPLAVNLACIIVNALAFKKAKAPRSTTSDASELLHFPSIEVLTIVALILMCVVGKS